MMHQSVEPTSGYEANYIVYGLDGDGRIRAAEWIAAGDDEEAQRLARELKHPFGCELWQRDRLVGRIAGL
jgi:hypothetical protein